MLLLFGGAYGSGGFGGEVDGDDGGSYGSFPHKVNA